MATRWLLNEVMARHFVSGREIAEDVGVGEDVVSKWRRSHAPYQRWDAIAASITKRSRVGGVVRGVDFVKEEP
ncbi:MAG: hypothetical protein ACRC62_10010 [Microcoleus sp.]